MPSISMVTRQMKILVYKIGQKSKVIRKKNFKHFFESPCSIYTDFIDHLRFQNKTAEVEYSNEFSPLTLYRGSCIQMLFTKKSLILEYYHFTISHNHVIQNHVCLCLQSALHTTPLVAANLSLISETRCWCHTASIAQEYIPISTRFVHEIYEHFTKTEIDWRKPISFILSDCENNKLSIFYNGIIKSYP